MTIEQSDPRHVAAQKVIEAMYEFWKLAPQRGAVQWIEDTEGRVIIFTRGECRDSLMGVVGGNLHPQQFFELE